MADKQVYGGHINALPVVDGGHFIENSEKRIVYGPGQFWEDYVVRAFTLFPGAGSAEHSHSWNHWTICTQGEGVFTVGDEVYALTQNAYVFVPEDIPHFFRNTSEHENLVLICIVPREGDVNPLDNCSC